MQVKNVNILNNEEFGLLLRMFLDFYKEAFTNYDPEIDSDFMLVDTFLRYLKIPNVFISGAYVDGQIVGFTLAIPSQLRLHTLYAVAVYVIPTYRHTTAWQRLYKSMLTESKKYKYIETCVTPKRLKDKYIKDGAMYVGTYVCRRMQ